MRHISTQTDVPLLIKPTWPEANPSKPIRKGAPSFSSRPGVFEAQLLLCGATSVA